MPAHASSLLTAARNQFRELVFNEPEGRPNDFRFRAAIAVALEPVRTAQTVLVRRALEPLGESLSFAAENLDCTRDP